MSFDTHLFDDGLFGSLAQTAIFDGAIFDSGSFDTGGDAPPIPPDPPAPVVVSFFGGGPFRRRYRREEEEELPKPEAEVVHEAVEQAVEAIRTEAKPKPVVLDAKRVYERVYRDVLAVEKERITEMWRAEVKRRLQEREEEEIVCLLMCL